MVSMQYHAQLIARKGLSSASASMTRSQYTPAPSRGPGDRAGSGGGEAALRPYEIVIIFDAGLDEAVIRSHVDRVTEHVRTHGGAVGAVDRWGKRSFAYELKHRHEGYYVLVEATAEPEVLAEVDRMLTLSDEVLRHKVIRQGGKKAGHEPAAVAAAVEAAPAS